VSRSHTIKLTGEETLVAQAAHGPDVPKEASLVQIYGPNVGNRYVLDKAETTIGRDASNDIHLDNENVSRAHARILNRGGAIVLEDLGSTNGSSVNDQDVKSIELRNDDIIKIGSVILKFLSGGNAEALYYEEIYKLTISDGLTGIANRRSFDDFLERELARAKRYERPLSLALFDIDHFKKVNDLHGHLAGDYVLRRLATKVKALVRREELIARYGGEEFAIVMPETRLDKAEMFAEKVRALVETTPFEFDKRQLQITISVGLAMLGPTVQDEVSLIKAADACLYQAKNRGRNRVVVA
jgi:two-component system, cell cycle response regulator